MEYKINKLPQKYEDIIIPMLNINDKFILAGSLSLYIMDIIEYNFTERVPDIDIGLKETLIEEDLRILHDFFQLNVKITDSEDYDMVTEKDNPDLAYAKVKSIPHFTNKELIQLEKHKDDKLEYSIDLFNSQYLKPKDVVHVNYDGYTMKLTHPSVILSHKSKYAYDVRVGKQYKHFADLQKINWDKYFTITKGIKTVYDKEYIKITHSSLGLPVSSEAIALFP
jgi:hypothetical protein